MWGENSLPRGSGVFRPLGKGECLKPELGHEGAKGLSPDTYMPFPPVMANRAMSLPALFRAAARVFVTGAGPFLAAGRPPTVFEPPEVAP